MHYIGIDPGKNGALAYIKDNSSFGHDNAVLHYNAPEKCSEMVALLNKLDAKNGTVLIEYVNSRNPAGRRMGNKSLATFMGHNQRWYDALDMLDIPIPTPTKKRGIQLIASVTNVITPQQWQSNFCNVVLQKGIKCYLPSGPDNYDVRKENVFKAVCEWFPTVKITKRNADAVAIALVALTRGNTKLNFKQ